ncbi:META domain-containing protein [Methanoculleus sp.]|uniref:META domain-containing protein n=1 Tax=Methanoculleus sp. TaxID=90427 RepID=UPI001BD3D7CA|nr:META domain-containing protein [Methanoculleus sp.]
MASNRRRNRNYILTTASLLVIVVACVIAAGCTSGTSTPGAVVGLTGTSWTLDSYLGENGTLVGVLPGTEVTAAFGHDGKVTGSAGCNGYGGDYRLDGTSLSVSSVAQTLKLCLEPDGIMEQEARFIDLLGSAEGYRIEDGRLILADSEGTDLLVFVKGGEPAALPGTSWTLASLAGEDGALISVLDGTTVTAAFGVDGKVGGSAGCNHYSADYTADGASLTIAPTIRTEMYCMDLPGVMEQEDRYLALLTDAAAYRVESGRLILTNQEGADLLVFNEVVRTPDLPLVGTEWTLESYNLNGEAVSSVIAGTTITATFSSDGNVTGNAGCNSYGAGYRLDGTSISIEPPISTKMNCNRPEGIMEQENRYLNLVASAAGYRIDGDRLDLLDEAGKTLLSYSADRP